MSISFLLDQNPMLGNSWGSDHAKLSQLAIVSFRRQFLRLRASFFDGQKPPAPQRAVFFKSQPTSAWSDLAQWRSLGNLRNEFLVARKSLIDAW
jgi:hypothetical protein